MWRRSVTICQSYQPRKKLRADSAHILENTRHQENLAEQKKSAREAPQESQEIYVGGPNSSNRTPVISVIVWPQTVPGTALYTEK